MRTADEALAGAGILHFIVEFTRSGGSMEMPCAPPLGRGYWWQVEVFREDVAQAAEVLRGLPMEPSAGLNARGDSPCRQRRKHGGFDAGFCKGWPLQDLWASFTFLAVERFFLQKRGAKRGRPGQFKVEGF